MAIIKCKMCGGDIELSADKTFGTCEYCGSTMTLPKADDEQRAAAFNRGNHFRRMGEFDKALAVYERIAQEDENDAEAHWCCALCRFGIEYVEDPTTFEYIPTCHRASFDSILEDVDYLAAVEYSDGITRRQYQKDAAKIAGVQKGVLTASQNTEPYDVFICYKEGDENGERTKDSMMAQDIYYQLTEQGRRTFFARITLEDIAGAQYEPYIFAALQSAKVMVVVTTSPEHVNAVWVKNEWSRYLALMRKEHGRLLLPCYRDMDPYDLPEQLSVLQSYDMAKIGFMQDLIRGISKVLDAAKPEKAAHETVVIQNSGNVQLDALLKRGKMALEDGSWEKADEFFDQVLNIEAENGEAYLGQFLAQIHGKNVADFVKIELEATANVESSLCSVNWEPLDAVLDKLEANYVIPYYLPGDALRSAIQKTEAGKALKTFEYSYPVCRDGREAQLKLETEKFETNKFFTKAIRFSTGELNTQLETAKNRILAEMEQRIDAAAQDDQKQEAARRTAYDTLVQAVEETAKEENAQAEENRETAYRSAADSLPKVQRSEDYMPILNVLSNIPDYKDAEKLLAQGKADRAEMKNQEDQRAKAKAKAKETRTTIIVFGLVFLAVATAIWKFVLVPKSAYHQAEALLEAGDYDAAAVAFAELGEYSDAATQVNNAHYQKAEALLEGGEYDAAALAFAELGEYSDAATQSQNAYYQKAESLLENGDYDGAALAFAELGDYSDATAQAQKAYYQEAEGLLAEGKKIEATLTFTKAGTYLDSVEKAAALWRKTAKRDTIAAGNDFTVGLKTDGAVVAIGFNRHGEYDTSWTDIVALATGYCHTVGLKADGTVTATGLNNRGQCNVLDWFNIVAIAGGGYHSLGLNTDGTVVAAGLNNHEQCNVSAWSNIIALAAGAIHTVGLKSDGTVVATGSNNYGQCDVSEWSNIVAVTAGTNHTVGLKSDGTVVATGYNHHGQCEVSEWTDIVSIAAGYYHTVGLKADGTVIVIGKNDKGQCETSEWIDIVDISAGDYHTVGLKLDGTVVATGLNDDGQCNVSGWTNIKLPD